MRDRNIKYYSNQGFKEMRCKNYSLLFSNKHSCAQKLLPTIFVSPFERYCSCQLHTSYSRAGQVKRHIHLSHHKWGEEAQGCTKLVILWFYIIWLSLFQKNSDPTEIWLCHVVMSLLYLESMLIPGAVKDFCNIREL